MSNVFDLLDNLGLGKESRLEETLEAMDEPALEELFSSVEEIVKDVPSHWAINSGLSLAPLGGAISMSDIEEVTKQALVYSDRLVLRNPLIDIHRNYISNEYPVAATRRLVYPAVLQLLRVKKLVTLDIVMIVDAQNSYPALQEDRHQLTAIDKENLADKLRSLTRVYQGNDGQIRLVLLDEPPFQTVIKPDLIVTNPTLVGGDYQQTIAETLKPELNFGVDENLRPASPTLLKDKECQLRAGYVEYICDRLSQVIDQKEISDFG